MYLTCVVVTPSQGHYATLPRDAQVRPAVTVAIWFHMCGRFSLGMDGDQVARLYGSDLAIPWQPRYSIAPSTIVLVLHQEDDTRVLAPREVGVPAWLG